MTMPQNCGACKHSGDETI